jgi:hypothetical protein
MEFVLHTHYSEPNPITYIAKAWATLCQIKEYREVESQYDFNGVGSLPVLRHGHYVFQAEHIVDFLRIAYDLDRDLSANEREEARLIEELVYSRLHPATLHALWTQGDPEHHGKWWLTQLLARPFKKLEHMRARRGLNAYLKQQHSIRSSREAFIQADQVHSRLSKRLGEALFFNSMEGRAEYPRSTDVVVAAYLSSELTYLGSHSHVVDSLDKYQNLKDFYYRVTNILNERCKVHDQLLPPEAQFFPPIYSPAAIKPQDVESLRHRLTCKQPELKQSESPDRSVFLTAAAGLFFTLALLTRQTND